MRLTSIWALLGVVALASGQDATAPPQPTVTLSAKAELLQDVLDRLQAQTHILMVADPFTAERRVTLEVNSAPLGEALDALAVAAVATWDAAYILTDGGPFGPQDQPAGWQRPPQTRLTLSGGSGSAEKITAALTNLSCAPVGYTPSLASLVVTTKPEQNAALEDVLSSVQGDHLTWARGFWFAPIDRAAVFGRYANLPPAEREQRVLRHVEQMLRLNKDDVRRALEARHREVAGMTQAQREAQIQHYADEIRAGVQVLNTLTGDVRDRARDAMEIFFEIGLLVYRDLSEDEQLEATPVIEAMGELQR
jgi:hypothetical protein